MRRAVATSLVGLLVIGGAAHLVAEELSTVCHRLTEGAADFPDPLPPAHARAIDCAAYYGVATGRSNGTFGGDVPVIRGQAASLLARAGNMAGVFNPDNSDVDSFDDDNGSVHEESIEDAAAYGIILGRGERRFDIDGTLSRGQAASMLIRTLVALEIPYETDPNAPDAFFDDNGSVHEDSLNQAAALGLVTGNGRGSVRPNDALTRGQAMSLLIRGMELIFELTFS